MPRNFIIRNQVLQVVKLALPGKIKRQLYIHQEKEERKIKNYRQVQEKTFRTRLLFISRTSSQPPQFPYLGDLLQVFYHLEQRE